MQPHFVQQTEGCPVMRLSEEILCLIMGLFVADDPEVSLPNTTSSRGSSVHTLTRVCSSWRDVAVGHQGLWTHIAVQLSSESPIPEDRLSVFLKRSGQLPLTISITVPPPDTSVEDRLQEIQKVLGMQIVQSRLKVLRMTLSTQLLCLLNERFTSSSSHSFINLSREVKEVHIAIFPPVFDIPPNIASSLTWPNATQLQRFTVVPADPSSKQLGSFVVVVGLDTSQLTHLNLSVTRHTPDMALWLLQRSPALLSFNISLCLDLTSTFHLNLGGQGIMVNHPIIQDLHVTMHSEMTPGVTLAAFLQHLSTPNLSEIKITHGSKHCAIILNSDSVAFLRRCHGLKTVHLHSVDEMDIKEVLRSCSSLLELDVVTELREKILPPLPKWYTESEEIDNRIDALEAMVMDRRPYSRPPNTKKDDISRLFSRLKKACPPSPPRQLRITIGEKSKTFSY